MAALENKYFAPHRGKVSVMAQKGTLVLKNGEIFVEVPDTGVGTGHSRIKLGDGKTAYSALPYAIGDTENDTISFTEDTSATADAAVAKVVSGAALKNDIAALKRAISLLIEKQGATYSFSKVTVGADVIAATAVGDNVTFKAGENVTLAADAAKKTVTVSAHDTTYDEATSNKAGLMSAADKAKMDGIEAKAQVNQKAFSNVKVGDTTVTAAAETDTVSVVAGDNVTVTADATTKSLTIAAHDTTYADATTTTHGLMSAADKAKMDGIEAGAQVNTITGIKGEAESAFRTGNVIISKKNLGLDKVDNTADADKVVASAGKLTTPVTISLSGAATGSASFDGSAATDIAVTKLDATKLTGIVPLDNIPHGALERLTVVADEKARLALTSADVQNGDTVKQNDTGVMYFVVDDSKLGTAAAFTEYTAATASAVEWANVENKPSVFPPAEHTHLYAGSATAGGAATSALKADEATKASQDAAGNDIQATYVKAIAAKGTTVTVTYGNGSTASFETQDNNTTYVDATTATHGLMSAADKAKMDGIAKGAEVNQNAFSYVKVGTDTVTAGSKTSTMTIAAGDNVTVKADTATNTVTVSAHDTTYENASTTAAGLMSAADKAKLDGVKAGANVVTVAQGLAASDANVVVGTVTVDGTATKLYAPKNTHYDSKTVVANAATGTADAAANIANGSVYLNHVENSKVTASHKISGAGTTTVTADADGNIIVTGIGVEYDEATDSTHGLMSAADKAKLDALGTVSGSDLILDFGEETLAG